jgi:transcriptional/translational regulatory protein YebC/TACO1
MGFEILTSKTDLNHVYKEISKLGYKIESAEVVKICKSPIEIPEEKEEKLHNFIEKMEESDDVLNVWHNVK